MRASSRSHLKRMVPWWRAVRPLHPIMVWALLEKKAIFFISASKFLLKVTEIWGGDICCRPSYVLMKKKNKKKKFIYIKAALYEIITIMIPKKVKFCLSKYGAIMFGGCDLFLKFFSEEFILMQIPIDS